MLRETRSPSLRKLLHRALSIYTPETAELAKGDRVRVTRNDAALDIVNGDRFEVVKATPASVTLTDGRRVLDLPADRPLHLDHAYTATVHSSQGTTADRVLVNAATHSRTTTKDVYYDKVLIHALTGGRNAKPWVHTHGLRELGLPELEISDVRRYSTLTPMPSSTA